MSSELGAPSCCAIAEPAVPNVIATIMAATVRTRIILFMGSFSFLFGFYS
jgi:hypothetical protein